MTLIRHVIGDQEVESLSGERFPDTNPWTPPAARSMRARDHDSATPSAAGPASPTARPQEGPPDAGVGTEAMGDAIAAEARRLLSAPSKRPGQSGSKPGR